QTGRQGRGDPEVRDCNREQRHRVEENRLAFCTHRALGMIGAANWAVEAFGSMSLRFQKIGRTAYWLGGLRPLASLPLGDAHPGGDWPYARGEQLKGSAATTPRAAGPFFIRRKCYPLRRRAQANGLIAVAANGPGGVGEKLQH